MHRYAIIVAAVAALLIAPGCDSSGSSNGDNSGSKGQATEEKQKNQKDERAENDKGKDDQETVEVPKDGKKFEPSVAASHMPKGAWHCNMNDKVHYAAMEKSNGTCPVCNMKLERK